MPGHWPVEAAFLEGGNDVLVLVVYHGRFLCDGLGSGEKRATSSQWPPSSSPVPNIS